MFLMRMLSVALFKYVRFAGVCFIRNANEGFSNTIDAIVIQNLKCTK